MATLVTPTPRQLFLNPTTGAPASGFRVYTYAAGTTTKTNTYTDNTGNTANANPILLDTLGEADIWLTSGTAYKFVFSPPTDTDPPTNAIWTRDNIQGATLAGPTSPWSVASGTVDAITAAYSPSVTSLTDGLLLGFRAMGANTLSNPTFKPDAQTAYVITDFGGKPLMAGAIFGANAECLVRFNLANNRWELLNAATKQPSWAVAGGTSDALTASYFPSNTALVDGLIVGVRATAANTTTTPTFAPDALTAATITKYGGTALAAGDIQNLSELLLRYNLSNNRWEILNIQNPVTALAWVIAGGTAQAITATYSPAVTVLTDGLILTARATAANTAAAPTFSPNGLTAHPITKNGGAALGAGDIAGNLAEIILRYNLANTRWELLNPSLIGPQPVQGVYFTVSGGGALTTQKTFGGASVVRNSTGNYTVTLGATVLNWGYCQATAGLSFTSNAFVFVPQTAGPYAASGTVTFNSLKQGVGQADCSDALILFY